LSIAYILPEVEWYGPLMKISKLFIKTPLLLWVTDAPAHWTLRLHKVGPTEACPSVPVLCTRALGEIQIFSVNHLW